LIVRFLFKLYMGVMEFENYDDNESLMHTLDNQGPLADYFDQSSRH